MIDYYLIAPQIIVAGFAVAVILLDLVLPRKGVLAGVSIIGLLGALAVTVALWGRPENENTLFNGMLRIDELAVFFGFLFCGVAVLVILASRDYVSKFARFQGEYYALILLSVAGMMMMAAARNLITIYVSLELVSMSLYALAAFLKDRKSSEAGLKYLLLGGIASAVLVYGMALIFGISGETGLDGIYNYLVAEGLGLDNGLLLLAVVFLIAGLGFKIATIPFQMWVPDVYEGAPTPVTAYLSVASKAVGFVVILRVFLVGFADPALVPDWAMIFAVLAAISMTLGNVVAIAQSNIKRMLGYSSIAQAGYLMVGLAAVTRVEEVGDPALFGPTGLLFFIGCYALANLGVFIAVIAITNKINSDEIKDFTGIGLRAPLVALAMTLCLVSLTGLPPTAGFLAKFYLFNAAVQHGLAWLVVIAVINTAISAYYYFRVVKVTWFGMPASQEGVPSSWALRGALAIACVGVLVLFFYPSGVLDIARDAAQAVAANVLP
ncbi:MAG: NADH-quinone oxidoreductase subunit N [Chloroflexi bacterium]|nr:MAG: NADH-quinone oxidoreductase subunit N [Chloroflexota bacterium]